MFKLISFLSTLVFFSPSFAFERPIPKTIINQYNVERFVEFIDNPIVELIQAGSVEIKVGEHYLISPNTQFLAQTMNYQGQPTIDFQTGHILNYQQGLPFNNEPDMNDVHAGLRIAWNMRYAYGGDSSLVDPFILDIRIIYPFNHYGQKVSRNYAKAS